MIAVCFETIFSILQEVEMKTVKDIDKSQL